MALGVADGDKVGDEVDVAVTLGAADGVSVDGIDDGLALGLADGDEVGIMVGLGVGFVGLNEGAFVGFEGFAVGFIVGLLVGRFVGMAVGKLAAAFASIPRDRNTASIFA